MTALIGGFGLIELQSAIDYFRSSFYTGPGLTWFSSLALYGALVLIALNAYLLLRAGSPDELADRVVQPHQALGPPQEFRGGQ